MTNFQEILQILADNHVEFILIGGLAAVAQGCNALTSDVDVVYARTRENYSGERMTLKL